MKVLVAILSLAVVALGYTCVLKGSPSRRVRDVPPLTIDAKEPKLVKPRNVPKFEPKVTTIKAPDDAIVIEFPNFTHRIGATSIYLHDDWMIYWQFEHEGPADFDVINIYYKGKRVDRLSSLSASGLQK